MTDQEPIFRLTVTPEPTEEEAAAVAAAIAILAAASPPPAVTRRVESSRWKMAGRTAAHSSSPRGSFIRWSRVDGWLANRPSRSGDRRKP